ncbi:MAG: Rieske (2Fe-2S) protein [Nitrososphaerota archaeon]|nr:Rieske (2Fe-2S) protein [Nitrososphaerota archaeon]MDG7024016.1 Rieske (2Fe-2S) protein [Nitrososphaerota archaeon]
MDRREFVRRASLTVVFGSIGALAFFEALGKLASPVPTMIPQTVGGGGGSQSQTSQIQTQTQTQAQTPVGYIYVAPASAVAGKTSAYFNHPTGGSCILIDYSGQWRAFSAICTHAGCAVNFTGSSLYCPCHGGSFSPANGAVQSGPPPSPLAEYGVVVQNGNLYVSKNIVN